MNIILDATLPPRFALMAQALFEPVHQTTHTRTALGHDATDERVREFVGAQPGAVVISVDLDISDNPHRIAALREWGVPVFLLTSSWLELGPTDQSWMFIRALPAMIGKAQAIPDPSVYLVAPGLKGRIRKIA